MPNHPFPLVFARDNLRKNWKFKYSYRPHKDLSSALRAMGGPALLNLYLESAGLPIAPTLDQIEPGVMVSKARHDWAKQVEKWWQYVSAGYEKRLEKQAKRRGAVMSPTGRRFRGIEKRIAEVEDRIDALKPILMAFAQRIDKLEKERNHD